LGDGAQDADRAVGERVCPRVARKVLAAGGGAVVPAIGSAPKLAENALLFLGPIRDRGTTTVTAVQGIEARGVEACHPAGDGICRADTGDRSGDGEGSAVCDRQQRTDAGNVVGALPAGASDPPECHPFRIRKRAQRGLLLSSHQQSPRR
jgi:hypothetical protein